MSKKLTFLFVAFIIFSSVAAQTYKLNPNQDILNYHFQIEVFTDQEKFDGLATVTVALKSGGELELDLVNESGGKGMVVSEVKANGQKVDFEHVNNKLRITSELLKAGENEVAIQYSGVPTTGLIIGESKFGVRTFFGDNYPDRARSWLPTVDHPADKATVTWKVTVPDPYRVVASGALVEQEDHKNNRETYTFVNKVPLSTKVMTFGAANFAVDTAGVVEDIPVTTWVYEENKAAGFKDFDIAPKVLEFFIKHIGPYPYAKLANVQSKTTYGGMENAGNIFYFENSVTGKREREALIAHEIAHQWFGNSATETDWSHAWLSEGFATYMTLYYKEKTKGDKHRREDMIRNRQRVIDYYHDRPLPIVDKTLVTAPKVEDLGELLSANTYQKGGWVLHMLRVELGSEVFWKGIRTYYDRYKLANASTEDFKAVMEEVSGKDLTWFFDQWLYRAGHPKIEGEWEYVNDGVKLTLRQTQPEKFDFPITVGLVYRTQVIYETIQMRGEEKAVSIKGRRPEAILIDPKIDLLYEGQTELTFKDNR